MSTIHTNSSKETLNFAKKFAKTLKGGEILGLVGDLGAGKTVFAKGLAEALGVKENIVSPTFVIMKVYNVKSKDQPDVKKFCHIDAYRIGENDIIGIGALDYFTRKDTISLIEWSDRIQAILPENTKIVNIRHLGDDHREIETNEIRNRKL